MGIGSSAAASAGKGTKLDQSGQPPAAAENVAFADEAAAVEYSAVEAEAQKLDNMGAPAKAARPTRTEEHELQGASREGVSVARFTDEVTAVLVEGEPSGDASADVKDEDDPPRHQNAEVITVAASAEAFSVSSPEGAIPAALTECSPVSAISQEVSNDQVQECELQISQPEDVNKLKCGLGDSDHTDLLVAAAEDEDWSAVEEILQDSTECNPNARTTDWGYSLIRAAAEEGQLEVCRLLVARRADINARDQNGMTPLMGCIVGSDAPELVALLLKAMSDVSLKTDDNFTALKWATRLNRESAITLLREAGCVGEASCF
jgi:hypothetical protein